MSANNNMVSSAMQPTTAIGESAVRTEIPTIAIEHDASSIDTSEKLDMSRTQSTPEYPPMKKVVVIMLSIFLTAFLISLDRTIIGTAIPKITDEFNSLGDVGWYASAYLMTMGGFQLLFGKIYSFGNIKYLYLGSIVIFEIGSAICGAAPDSVSFIVGRAVAGMGSAGILSGAVPIFVQLLPLDKRAAWMGFFGLVNGLASVIAPLLGGAFTTKVSWRWCFYINLPIGAVTFLIVVLILKLPENQKSLDPTAKDLSWKQKLNRLDPIGTLVWFPCIICLLIALQWGGTTYAWSNYRIVILLVFFVVLLGAFIAIQFWRGENATIPIRILTKCRDVPASMFFTFCNSAAMFVLVYYLPIWFQAIKGVDAEKSGIDNLGLLLALVVSSIFSGIATKKLGYYTQWLYISAITVPIGVGLISTFNVNTGHAKWIGYQVIAGLGLGFGLAQPMLVMQTVLQKRDVATGIALVFFMQTLGAAIFTSVGSSIFTNTFAKNLSAINGIDALQVAHIGATDLRTFVPAQYLSQVLVAYNGALVQAFYVGVGVSCFTIFACIPIQWKSVKSEQKPVQKDIEKQETVEEKI